MSDLHIAIDLGGSHGRVSVGGKNQCLDSIYNFETRFGVINNNVYWGILSMFQEIKYGIKLAYKKYGNKIVSIGFYTWGVDYGIISSDVIGLTKEYDVSSLDESIRANGIEFMTK